MQLIYICNNSWRERERERFIRNRERERERERYFKKRERERERERFIRNNLHNGVVWAHRTTERVRRKPAHLPPAPQHRRIPLCALSPTVPPYPHTTVTVFLRPQKG